MSRYWWFDCICWSMTCLVHTWNDRVHLEVTRAHQDFSRVPWLTTSSGFLLVLRTTGNYIDECCPEDIPRTDYWTNVLSDTSHVMLATVTRGSWGRPQDFSRPVFKRPQDTRRSWGQGLSTFQNARRL
jgi:hypothetical protein